MPVSFNQKPHTKSSGKKMRKDSFKVRLANAISSFILGTKVHATHLPKSAVAGVVIYWYFENGVRQFVLVKNHAEHKSPEARFVSCLGLGKYKSMSEAVIGTSDVLLGKVFARALDKSLLAADRVSAAPTFSTEDPVTGGSFPVHSLVWCVQITQEQAQLCEPEHNIEVIAVPEFALNGELVSPSHQSIYKACLRHIHANNQIMQDFAIEQLEDLLSGHQRSNAKTIH